MHYTLRPKRVNTEQWAWQRFSHAHAHTHTAVAANGTHVRKFALNIVLWLANGEHQSSQFRIYSRAYITLYILSVRLSMWPAGWLECDVACERATDKNQHKVVYGSVCICFFSFSVSLANARNDLCPILFALRCGWIWMRPLWECLHEIWWDALWPMKMSPR